jgi:putrescine transport system substrate-binding protein
MNRNDTLERKMTKSKKYWHTAACFVTLGLSVTSHAEAAGQLLKIYNWSDYIDPKVIDDFTKETGIKVKYDTFDAMETVETKVMAGKTGYDLVNVSASFLPRHIPLNVYTELDKVLLPNLKNMWPVITDHLAAYDPGNKYAVNYMWGTTGIGYNVTKIKQRLGDEAVDGWKLIFDEATLSKVADCGVDIVDASDELFPAALIYLGLDPDSKKPEDLEKAYQLLLKLKGKIHKYNSSEYINSLANGDICIAVGYSGDILQAKKRANEAKDPIELAYVIPKEGALMWFDSFVIPRDAPNKDAAYKFIDYVNRPEVAARNSAFIQYASGNLAAQKFLDPSILNDPGVYPKSDTLTRLHTVTPFDEKTQRSVNRMWTKIKTGR